MMIAGPTDRSPTICASSPTAANSSTARPSASSCASAPSPGQAYELLSAAEAAVEQRRTHAGMLREIRKDEGPPSDYLAQVAGQFNW